MADPTLRCPRCALLMSRVERDSVHIDVCPACRSTWFDTGELELVTFCAPPSAADATPSNDDGLPCPRCQRPLRRSQDKKHGAAMDLCVHGALLGEKEVRRLARSPQEEDGPSDAVVEVAAGGIELGAEVLFANPELADAGFDALGNVAEALLDCAGDLFSAL